MREVPVGCRRHLRARRPRRLPLERPDVRDPGAGGRGRADRPRLAARARTARCSPLVLAAAALCEVEEVYAMGGAQAIFALAYGTETIAAGRRDRRPRQRLGPGGEARASTATVGIDSLAGPSELMVIAGHDADPEWVALDLCAQAEHGADSPLVVVAVEEHVLDAIAAATEAAAAERPSVADAPLALVQVPDARAPRSTSPTPSPPSTSSCSRRTRRCSPSG